MANTEEYTYRIRGGVQERKLFVQVFEEHGLSVYRYSREHRSTYHCRNDAEKMRVAWERFLVEMERLRAYLDNAFEDFMSVRHS